MANKNYLFHQTRCILLYSALMFALTFSTYSRNTQWLTPSALWSSAVTNSPHKPRVLLNLGNAHTKAGNYEQALIYYQSALLVQPSYPDVMNGMGYAYLSMGQYEPALQYLTAALKMAPNHDGAHYNLGLLYLTMGDCYFEKAKMEIAIALKLNPADEEARQLLRNLEWSPSSERLIQ